MKIVLYLCLLSIIFKTLFAEDVDIYKREKGQLSCVLKNSKTNLFNYDIKYDRKAFYRVTRLGEFAPGNLIDDIQTFELHETVDDKSYEITYPEGNIEFSLTDKAGKALINKIVLLDNVIKMKEGDKLTVEGDNGHRIDCLRLGFEEIANKNTAVFDRRKSPKLSDGLEVREVKKDSSKAK